MSIKNTTIKPKSTYNNFLKQLKIGQKYEKLAAQKIQLLKPDITTISFNDNFKFDFQTFPDNLKYEIKYDKVALSTNNFFIEFYGYNKPSGLTITEADYYIITDSNYYFMINVQKLKDITKNCKIMKTKDGSTSGFILNRLSLVKNSTVLI
jgi:hypothetical protein